MSEFMETIKSHKIAIVVLAGGAIGIYFLLSKSGSSGSSSGSSSTSPSALSAYYQAQLGQQQQANSLALQSQSIASATQVGLAQAAVQNHANNLMGLGYTIGSINQVLMNQNNNQAGLFGQQASTYGGLGAAGYGGVSQTVISKNQLAQARSSGHFSGFGMNIGSGGNAGGNAVTG